jgi:hypothetical protein
MMKFRDDQCGFSPVDDRISITDIKASEHNTGAAALARRSAERARPESSTPSTAPPPSKPISML